MSSPSYAPPAVPQLAAEAAARLQAAAGPNEIVVAETVFKKLAAPPERAEHRLIEAKGKREPLPVYVLQPD